MFRAIGSAFRALLDLISGGRREQPPQLPVRDVEEEILFIENSQFPAPYPGTN